MIELEALAVSWSMSKCRWYHLGLPTFDLVIGHRPLVPIFNTYTLDVIKKTPRIIEKMIPYVFTNIWQKGSDHTILDVLSSHPVDIPQEDDEETAVALQCDAQQVIILAVTTVVEELLMLRDPILDGLREHACHDVECRLLSDMVRDGFPLNRSNWDCQL